MNKKHTMFSRKAIGFITSASVIAVVGVSVAFAAITFNNTSITGDSSFNNFILGTSTASNNFLFIASSSPIFVVSSTGLGLVGVGTSSPSQLFTVATSSNAFTVDLFGNASTTNNSTVGGYLQVVGQTIFVSASGTSIGLSGASYNLGNLGVGTTTLSQLLFVATSSPIFVVSSTGQIMIATTSIPQAGALFTIATSSNIFSVLPGTVNVSTTFNVTGAATFGSTGYFISNLSGGTSTLSNLLFIATSSPIFFVGSTGRVGIGTSTPSSLFTVASSSDIFTVDARPGTSTVRIAVHLNSTGTVPTIGTCGTSPSMVGTDNAALITVGTGNPTACSYVFATAWKSLPVCTANVVATSTAISLTIASSTVASTTIISSANIGSSKIAVICVGID